MAREPKPETVIRNLRRELADAQREARDERSRFDAALRDSRALAKERDDLRAEVAEWKRRFDVLLSKVRGLEADHE